MKIPIFCSLIPVELLMELGFEPDFIDGDDLFASTQKSSQCLFHDNLCPYVKALYDYLVASKEKYCAMVIPASCDAMKKLYNSVKSGLPQLPTFIIDVPRKDKASAATLYADTLEGLRQSLLKLHCLPPVNSLAQEETSKRDGGQIGILGSNIPDNIITKTLRLNGLEPVYLNHCTVKSRPSAEAFKALRNNPTFKEYAQFKLSNQTCPRIADGKYIEKIVAAAEEMKLKGIIVQTFKFCDFQTFDYNRILDRIGEKCPVLLLEHEGFSKSEGQIMTRLEAFLEKLKLKKSGHGDAKNAEKLWFVGIDSGSHATKIACINEKKEIVFCDITPTGVSVKESVDKLIHNMMAKTGCSDIKKYVITATGYGRNQIGCSNKSVTEITCHAKGAFKRLMSAATIIDIGGQDSKVVKFNSSGDVTRFAMNDKCAAGTGRFLEVIAERLQLPLSEFAILASRSDSSAPISNMCTVFAESEVISLIAAGNSRESIAKGIHMAIAERTASLVKRAEGEAPFYMSGGVAKNSSIVKELESFLDEKISVIENPQLNGAIGAAMISLEGLQ